MKESGTMVILTDKTTIRCTCNHRLLCKGAIFKKAEEITTEDILIISGNFHTVKKVNKVYSIY